MKAVLYFGVPLVFAVALFVGRPRPASYWAWFAAVCALTHVAVFAYGEREYGHRIISSDFFFAMLLMVAIPWALLAALTHLSVHSRDDASPSPAWDRRKTVAVLIPVVWGTASYVGYLVGVSLGVVYEYTQ